MILSKTFTIETRLNQRDNAEILEYAKEYNVLYGKMLRFTWHRYNNGGTFNMKKSRFNTILQQTFGVSRRLASSVISEVEGLYKALYQLKRYEYEQLKRKVDKKRKKIKKLTKKVYAIREKTKGTGFTDSLLGFMNPVFDSALLSGIVALLFSGISLSMMAYIFLHTHPLVLPQTKSRHLLRSSANQPHGAKEKEPAERNS